MTRAQVQPFMLNAQTTKSWLCLSAVSLALAAFPSSGATFQTLTQPLKLTLEKTTVSGLSSGGFMANQMHIAHSDWIQGAGIIAAGPNYCAQNSLTTALSECIGSPKKPLDLAKINQQIQKWEGAQKIRPLRHLKDDKVWILAGTKDQKVSTKVVNKLKEQYATWVPESQIKYESTKAFAHHFPTRNQGSDCAKSESPFIGQCGFDAAGEILSHLYADISSPGKADDSRIKRIPTKQLPNDLGDTLGENAYAYVPASCEQGATCQLHIAFHGCNQNETAIGQQFIQKTGYNRWAETNHLVVLYPQTKNSNMMPFNPQGCWDWWGYTNENYATLQGKQIMAIEALAKGLTGK